MATLIDSYPESNQSTTSEVFGVRKWGQSFHCTNEVVLNSVRFYIRKIGTPSGNVNAYIYAHTGTYGTDSNITGSPLAISDDIVASSLSTTLTLQSFTFSGANAITFSASTNYVAILSAPDAEDTSNYVMVGRDTTSPTHAGNAVYFIASWVGDSSIDVCFYVYGEGDAPASVTGPFPTSRLDLL
mgnify:CR=1 FL=1